MKVKEETLILIVMVLFLIAAALIFYFIPLEQTETLRETFAGLTVITTVTLYLIVHN